MKKLNKQQKAAVQTTARIVYIEAGAGTGKTSVIEARVQYLIEKGISPRNILILAFNTEVVNILRERFSSITGLDIRTFHSLGKAVIESYENCHISDNLIEDTSKLITKIKNNLQSKALKMMIFGKCFSNVVRILVI